MGFKKADIFVDKNIKYRLWYGSEPYQFIDVRTYDCVLSNILIECKFKDESPIIQIKAYTDYIEIEKENSVWRLYHYTNEENMFLVFQYKK